MSKIINFKGLDKSQKGDVEKKNTAPNIISIKRSDEGDAYRENPQEESVPDDIITEEEQRAVSADCVKRIFTSLVVGVAFLTLTLAFILAGWQDIILIICCMIVAVAFGGIFGFRMFHYRTGKAETVLAVCIGRNRSGYRRQYVQYEFQIVGQEDKTFTLSSTQKSPFHRGVTYVMCFQRPQTGELCCTRNLLGHVRRNAN